MPLSEARFMKKLSPTTTYIYGEKVVIILWEKDKLIAIMIKDGTISKSYKEFFETIWKVASK